MIKPMRTISVAIYDDVVAARGEQFHIPGLEVRVYGDADDCVNQVLAEAFDVVFMDFSLGANHRSGDEAVRSLRKNGYEGRIVAISSDPAANARMLAAGANDALALKAHLRSYLVSLGESV